MKKLILLSLGIILEVQIASATGMSMRSFCNPVLTSDGNAKLILHTVSMAPPGGPVTSSQTLSVDGKDYKRLSSGKYEQGITMKMVPLKYPSGSISSSLSFITLNPGKSIVSPIKEALYNCVSKPGM